MTEFAISFGKFTVDESQQLIKESTICLPTTLTTKSNKQNANLSLHNEYNQILIPFPDKDAIYCRRCYGKNHYEYDCFSRKTISGLPLKERIPLVIIRRIKHDEDKNMDMKPQKKSAENICYDAEIASSLEGLYWAGQCSMYNHAYTFAENNMALYGRYY